MQVMARERSGAHAVAHACLQLAPRDCRPAGAGPMPPKHVDALKAIIGKHVPLPETLNYAVEMQDSAYTGGGRQERQEGRMEMEA